MNDDVERLRRDDDDDADDRTRSSRPAIPVGLIVLGKTKTLSTYPNAVGKAFAFTPQAVLGAETEGASAVLTDLGSTQFAFLLAGSVPSSGSEIVARYVPHRFVFVY